jgi:hypothetical protein
MQLFKTDYKPDLVAKWKGVVCRHIKMACFSTTRTNERLGK